MVTPRHRKNQVLFSVQCAIFFPRIGKQEIWICSINRVLRNVGIFHACKLSQMLFFFLFHLYLGNWCKSLKKKKKEELRFLLHVSRKADLLLHVFRSGCYGETTPTKMRLIVTWERKKWIVPGFAFWFPSYSWIDDAKLLKHS